jgi:hypothetical protein
MRRINRKIFIVITGLSLIFLLDGKALIHSSTFENQTSTNSVQLPLLIAHQGSASSLERPTVAFDHDRHTKAVGQAKVQDCAVCHLLSESNALLTNPKVAIFKFPKEQFDERDKTAVMYAYHAACVGCHKRMAAERKQTGPLIGRCGKCHVKKVAFEKVVWAWSPIFNYARHAEHLQAAEKFDPADKLNVTEKVDVVGETTGKRCETCHHIYDEQQKKLVYKKDTENSCRGCHKAKDEKNARSMKKVAHSACIGCHMKLAEKVRKELLQEERTVLTERDKKRFGPFNCAGCHGKHKDLTPEDTEKIPRLVRGQKDVMDLALVESTPDNPVPAQTGRMKTVGYNHKAHEPRVQFCNACHHHSLEKCSNCHTRQGDATKGGGVTYERAFHKVTAKQACVGCHESAKEGSKCAGCHHQAIVETPKSSCPVCHRGPSDGKPVDAPGLPLVFDKERVPENLAIKLLEKEFKPAEFPHRKIVTKLTAISNQSSLARVFHAAGGQETLCAGCHHKTDYAAAQTKKTPQCSSCHSRPFDRKELGKPGILGAYHRQCIGCHQAMKQKPVALECVKCHPAKEGRQTAGLIPPVPGTK